MESIFLIKYGELAIKGKNRYKFENKLVETIKKSLFQIGVFSVRKEQGRIVAEPLEENINIDQVIDKLTNIFGIIGVAYGTKRKEQTFEAIKELAKEHIEELLSSGENRTFKVETKRADKRFEMSSMEVSANLGAYLLDEFPDQLKVDVKNPEITLVVEIRTEVYVYSKTYAGIGGMPYGTNGKATLLLSGGIDSPVAGWMIAKRGVEIEAVYFHSPPYTSERAKDKVIELGKKLARYTGSLKIHVVPFTAIQLAIQEHCPHAQLTIIMRRLMMELAIRISNKNNSVALITGESIGQVASQTINSIVVTNEASDRPVFRPLIGFDKVDIIDIAKKIDTFETSILPYEDCCTIFVPKHPETKPKLEYIKKSERALDLIIDEMIENALQETEIILL
ncbi:tRNA 4-thiouridine(8) synthase ThiI [Candidatus Epulonipiscium fishelsonii]|uniref:tRNA 4-thiouridine(8) synthase ThiI n=1 Tax=Candidatus Epulonipiscium fishelsonii TaxID=77094 RepID=A0ACC8XFJ4_9FIRM|nr:tRNA 4-thiouridine(8) synthase ThiI [Epulopiscium sp. SCG-B05WGA-EpuloA1]ONI42050.1 tRNA 4-thiouridine(8) synthase ThiI [Epulopiscium sp. SCG-B11WGA-EpuloA1]